MFKTAYYMLLDSDLRESAIMSQGRPIPAKEAYVYTLYVLYVTVVTTLFAITNW